MNRTELGSLMVVEAGGSNAGRIGNNLIPPGALYDGSGSYNFNVVVGLNYQVTLGPNDAAMSNGVPGGGSGTFTAGSPTVTFESPANVPFIPVTAILKHI